MGIIDKCGVRRDATKHFALSDWTLLSLYFMFINANLKQVLS